MAINQRLLVSRTAKELSSLKFGLDVFGLFEARVLAGFLDDKSTLDAM